MICYLGLGSNLKFPQRQLHQAIQDCRHIPLSTVTKVSSIYLSNPVGVRSQPLFYNLVIELNTSLSPEKLLEYCLAIEKKHHRIRKQRWGARTLDLDILLYGNVTLSTPKLSIPHPQMLNRDFVIIPLLEIAPEACMPNKQLINKLCLDLPVNVTKNVTI